MRKVAIGRTSGAVRRLVLAICAIGVLTAGLVLALQTRSPLREGSTGVSAESTWGRRVSFEVVAGTNHLSLSIPTETVVSSEEEWRRFCGQEPAPSVDFARSTLIAFSLSGPGSACVLRVDRIEEANDAIHVVYTSGTVGLGRAFFSQSLLVALPKTGKPVIFHSQAPSPQD